MYKIIYIITFNFLLFTITLTISEKLINKSEVNSIVKKAPLLTYILLHSLERQTVSITLKNYIQIKYVIYAYLNMKSNSLNVSKKRMLYQ